MSDEQDIGTTSKRLFKGFNIKLKGATRSDTLENCSIAGIVVGVIMFAVGMGLTAISTTGISALLTILGSFVSFIATIFLIFVWLAKELKSD